MVLYEPILSFRIGPIAIGTYIFFVSIGAIILTLLTLKEAEKRKIKCMIYAVPFIVIFSYIGVRLLYFFTKIGSKGKILDVLLDFKESGGIFYGGLLLPVLIIILFAKIRKGNPLQYLDCFAIGLPLGMFIGRIGCFLHGCCYGITTKSSLALFYIKSGVMVHPTQLYSSFFHLCTFVFMVYLSQKKRFGGFMILIWFLIYSVFRFLIEFIRYEPKVYLGLSLSQLISIGIFAVSLIFLWRLKNER